MVVEAIAQARSLEATPTLGSSPGLLSLDLGSGPYPAAGYVGVDLPASELPSEVVACNLLDGHPWPFDDGVAERLRASHFIEHIPHERVKVGRVRVRRTVKSPGRPAREMPAAYIDRTQDAFFWFFDEAWRIAAPGCRFELAWPHPDSDEADQDPTHTRRVRGSTLNYLSRAGRHALGVQHYDVHSDWQLEGGRYHELAREGALDPFTAPDGTVDIAAARRARGVFTEIRAVLIKPSPEV